MKASEARKLSEENDSDKILQEILNEIRRAAENGKTDIKVYCAEFGSGRMYGSTYEDFNNVQKSIIDSLNNLGYTTYIDVEYRCEFADIFLRVSWKDA